MTNIKIVNYSDLEGYSEVAESDNFT